MALPALHTARPPPSAYPTEASRSCLCSRCLSRCAGRKGEGKWRRKGKAGGEENCGGRQLHGMSLTKAADTDLVGHRSTLNPHGDSLLLVWRYFAFHAAIALGLPHSESLLPSA
ncbi:hypothetical protein AMTR_s00100p00035100 [Amborella trichopoda]|uniref:Uncharacterized protein n=1 Tax=Amborella trichopoda TaxID=13333 RepID=W1NYE7_AMBTC|nr:hypothetical protein AMTR_s00100p00035100 [Amborella trichopoda]